MMSRSWSCDTYVAQADSTADGRLIFGKNSDRPAGEAQPLRLLPQQDRGSRLDLAYVSLPDEPAYAHLGSAPFWCWGYEIGINEHDVMIGNEALFTRSWAENVSAAEAGNPPPGGILGMELVRLGLERGRSALAALEVMTGLLERHGQWGSCAVGTDPSDVGYDNSYVIADRADAWVLETSGREWIARQVSSGTCSISNQPSIRSEYTRISSGLVDTARKRGWMAPGESFDFAASHADLMTPLQTSHIRQRRSAQLLEEARAAGGLDMHSARAILRDHFEGTFLDGPYLNAARPDFPTLCMHEHAAENTWGNTAASMIVEMGAAADDLTVIWWTPLSPCVGAYIPIFLQSAELPGSLQLPRPIAEVRAPETHLQARFDPASYWWRFQNLLDAAKGDPQGSQFARRQSAIRARFDQLEADWTGAVEEMRQNWKAADAAERHRLAEDLSALTARAASAVDAEIEALFAEYAPEAHHKALDPRWV